MTLPSIEWVEAKRPLRGAPTLQPSLAHPTGSASRRSDWIFAAWHEYFVKKDGRRENYASTRLWADRLNLEEDLCLRAVGGKLPERARRRDLHPGLWGEGGTRLPERGRGLVVCWHKLVHSFRSTGQPILLFTETFVGEICKYVTYVEELWKIRRNSRKALRCVDLNLFSSHHACDTFYQAEIRKYPSHTEEIWKFKQAADKQKKKK